MGVTKDSHSTISVLMLNTLYILDETISNTLKKVYQQILVKDPFKIRGCEKLLLLCTKESHMRFNPNQAVKLPLSFHSDGLHAVGK